MLLFLQGCLPLVSQQLCWVGDLSKVIILCALWLITIETTVPLFLSPTRLSLHYAASLLDKRVCALSIQLHDRHKCNRKHGSKPSGTTSRVLHACCTVFKLTEPLSKRNMASLRNSDSVLEIMFAEEEGRWLNYFPVQLYNKHRTTVNDMFLAVARYVFSRIENKLVGGTYSFLGWWPFFLLVGHVFS